MRVCVIVGTEKGAFLVRSDRSRRDWKIEGPLFKGWKVTAIARLSSGRTMFGVASFVYGATLHVSSGTSGPHDLSSWRQIPNGPAFDAARKRKLNQIWTLVEAAGAIWAGVDEAALFRSEDGGESWSLVTGLEEHRTRGSWYPGFGGLCAHSVLVDPRNPRRLWCGISAVGVFRSDDGGASWEPKNSGVPVIIEDAEHKDIGFCVHALARDPDDPSTIYRQDHMGMFRTRDAGDSWQRIENGLPSRFGFPLAIDRATGALFAVPLESDEHRMPIDGKFRVYRSRDRGDSWESLGRGLPAEGSYMGVLRSAVAVDAIQPCGVYVGTTAGTLHVSSDGGDSWRTLPCTLPRISCVAAFVED
ncbi:MAG: exo-alpha-sialidase [Planctomycetes bacterium]|nr:exo-alpha-sialidase [Planctomycetota bacterium]MBI3846442.1 exo-alpha-sialidase [Planctomycetota bacterium]